MATEKWNVEETDDGLILVVTEAPRRCICILGDGDRDARVRDAAALACTPQMRQVCDLLDGWISDERGTAQDLAVIGVLAAVALSRVAELEQRHKWPREG